MSTNSRIGMVQEDGSVKSIYCHWDGYVSHNGKILKENYTDPEKVKSLIELGSISYLRTEVEPTEAHTFNSPQRGITLAYHRDRGEELCIEKDPTVSSFLKRDEPFLYLFTLEGEWEFK